MSVQTYQQQILIYRRCLFVYHYWRCTPIYRPTSYPFISMFKTATCKNQLYTWITEILWLESPTSAAALIAAALTLLADALPLAKSSRLDRANRRLMSLYSGPDWSLMAVHRPVAQSLSSRNKDFLYGISNCSGHAPRGL